MKSEKENEKLVELKNLSETKAGLEVKGKLLRKVEGLLDLEGCF